MNTDIFTRNATIYLSIESILEMCFRVFLVTVMLANSSQIFILCGPVLINTETTGLIGRYLNLDKW